MAVKERSRASSQRQNWQNTFNGLVQMIRDQQSQLETLAKDRQLLEDRVRTQNERWTYDIRLLEDQISQVTSPIFISHYPWIKIRVLEKVVLSFAPICCDFLVIFGVDEGGFGISRVGGLPSGGQV